MGPNTFQLMRSLVIPNWLDNFSYDELVSKLKDHKEPALLVIVRRFQFNTHNQKPGESIVEYITVLHKAAEHYSYGNSLSEMLRDKLVCGITNSVVQKCLLAEKEFSLNKAVVLAQSVEMAKQGAKDLQTFVPFKSTTTPDVELFKINPGTSTKGQKDKSAGKSKTCYRCGGKHLATQCQFKAECCHNCGKQGQIAKVFRSRLQCKKAQTVSSKQVHNITDGPLDIEYQLFVVHTSSSSPLKTTLQVEGQELAMEIDTGAAVSSVSEETVNSSFMKDLPLVCTY